MTVIARLHRLAIYASVALFITSNCGPSSAEDDWAPVHTSRSASGAKGSIADYSVVRQTTHLGPHETSGQPRWKQPQPPQPAFTKPVSKRSAPVQQTSLRMGTVSERDCNCQRCAGKSPQRPIRSELASQPRCCTVYSIFDSLAGGIEHVLGLEPPAKKCGPMGCHDLHDFDGAQPIVLRERTGTSSVGPLGPPKRLPSSRSLAPPMPPIDVDSFPVVPEETPLSDPIEEVEPKTVPRLPAPVVPDELADPFEDDQAWVPGRNAAIKRSAYYE